MRFPHCAAVLAVVTAAAGTASGYANPNTPPTTQPPQPGQITPIALQAPATCAPPSATTCVDQVWVRFCGQLWGATDPNSTSNPCYAINYTTASRTRQGPVNEKVFHPGTQTFINATSPKVSGLATYRTGTATTWATQEEKAKFEALSKPSWLPARLHMRDYVAKGYPIDSCEDYVYRSFYDVERWIDAINACGNDDRCKVDVSLHGMGDTTPAEVPGIARREMRDSDGGLIKDRLPSLAVYQREIDPFTADYRLDVVPKNAFYANTRLLITPSLLAQLPAGMSAQVQLMLNEIWRGSKLYDVTGSAPTTGGRTFVDAKGQVHRGYVDEWDWHKQMFTRTAGLTNGEAREYRRRGDAVLRLLDLLADDTKCAMAMHLGAYDETCGRTMPSALGKVNPGDDQMWQGDPFGARTMIGNITPEAWVSPPALQGQIGFGTNLQSIGVPLASLLDGSITRGIELLGPTSNLPGLVIGGSAPQAPAMQAMSHTSNSPFGSTPPGRSQGTTSTSALVKLLNVDGPAPVFDAAQGITVSNLGGVIDWMWTINPPRVDANGPYPRLDCRVARRGDHAAGHDSVIGNPVGGLVPIDTAEGGTTLVPDTHYGTEAYWSTACELTNLLIDEWARYQDHKPSCLDPKNTDCDWMPKDFVDRFVVQNVGYGNAAKEVEYKLCKRWTGGGQVQHADTQHIGIAPSVGSWLPSIRDLFDDRREDFEERFKTVPVKGTNDFGTVRTDGNKVGNDEFGGGYQYTLGWHLKAYERVPQTRAGGTNAGNICRVGGNVLATFTAQASLFGHPFDILDAGGTVSSNDGDTGQAYGNARLYVVGYEVFDTKGNIDISGGWSDVKMNGAKPQLIEVPFQVGWVTVTVSAGISYDYGVMVDFQVKTPRPTDCDPVAPAFLASSTFMPFANLGGWVDADVSLAGIIGVGVEIELTLVGINLPLHAKLDLGTAQNLLSIEFDAGLELVLTTLKGELSFYLEAFWTKVFSVPIVKWDGFKYTLPIFRTPLVALHLSELPEGTILPPGGVALSESK